MGTRAKEKPKAKIAAPAAAGDETAEKDQAATVPLRKIGRGEGFPEEELLPDDRGDDKALDEDGVAEELGEEEESLDETELNPFGDKWEE